MWIKYGALILQKAHFEEENLERKFSENEDYSEVPRTQFIKHIYCALSTFFSNQFTYQ